MQLLEIAKKTYRTRSLDPINIDEMVEQAAKLLVSLTEHAQREVYQGDLSDMDGPAREKFLSKYPDVEHYLSDSKYSEWIEEDIFNMAHSAKMRAIEMWKEKWYK